MITFSSDDQDRIDRNDRMTSVEASYANQQQVRDPDSLWLVIVRKVYEINDLLTSPGVSSCALPVSNQYSNPPSVATAI